MFGIGKFLYVTLLLVNGIAVLSEDRFLSRIGWSTSDQAAFSNPGEGSVKTRLVDLIGATRTLLRLPLIGINTIVIIYELVLG
ncbi:hypothetical protein BABINDRAFT_58133 [Babjeviella inositovora NRRL Y-12698]|uniref:Yos1-like protein n=1 Tax=Babjeviella inositovora NRRL Y-12698 TaxID=984486 RepID=A0A1E3QVC6_9ASCO|nr:uncharacterized protein BABINDRAFT_58133 [Babjeviella inositovora NRRL Y-12698]ODQ81610.1 hypothetical protein BABINDRAFT_58133 [Babjeviella inositovora NRRL Y-12698]